MKLYSDLASWWPLMSAVEDYAPEADFFWPLLVDANGRSPQTVLELGCGGGNFTSHLKHLAQWTLTDLSPAMLDVSRNLNAECEHILGDMRSVRLNRLFDAVLIHDAIMYATTEYDLRRTIETIATHCRPGGTALLIPDYVGENFRESTEHGGHDRDGRSLRYLQWNYDPDPLDTEYTGLFVLILRDLHSSPRIELDEHRFGVFPREIWLSLLRAACFDVRTVIDRWQREVFVCRRRMNPHA